MTENKRFECDKGSRIIIDNESKLHYIMTLDWECSLVTKLLNRFAEENEQLEDALNQRTEQCDKYYKENEELKSRIKELEIINEAQSDAIDGLQETMCHLDLSELNGDVE